MMIGVFCVLLGRSEVDSMLVDLYICNNNKKNKI